VGVVIAATLDVAAVFPDDRAVNEALRLVLKIKSELQHLG
jgi:hypothetical protein